MVPLRPDRTLMGGTGGLSFLGVCTEPPMRLRAGERVPPRGSQAAPLGVNVRPGALLMGRQAEDIGESNVTFMQNKHGHVPCWQVPTHRCRERVWEDRK